MEEPAMHITVGWIICAGLLVLFFTMIAWHLLTDEDRFESVFEDAMLDDPDLFRELAGSRVWHYRGWQMGTADAFQGVIVWEPAVPGKKRLVLLTENSVTAFLFVDMRCASKAREYAQ